MTSKPFLRYWYDNIFVYFFLAMQIGCEFLKYITNNAFRRSVKSHIIISNFLPSYTYIMNFEISQPTHSIITNLFKIITKLFKKYET